MREINVSTNEAGQRLDKLLRKYLKNANTSFIYKMLRKKNIVLNDKKAEGKEILNLGDSVKMYFSEETFATMTGRTEQYSGSAEKNREMSANASAPRACPASDKTSSAGKNSAQTYRNGSSTGKSSAQAYRNESPAGKRAQTRRGESSVSASERGDQRAFDINEFRKHIVYEDENLLVLNKPAGWLSQSDASGLPSVNERCLQYLMATGALTEAQLQTFKPGIANRLDRNTSGLILFGKTLPALQALAGLLRDRTMEKYYLAIVCGDIDHAQRIDGYLAKDERTNRVEIRPQPFPDAAEIHTAYEPLKRSGDYTVLKVHLITGKTHQIRAHLRAIGHPIIGDPKYGRKDANAYYRTHGGVKSQLLHAWELHFPENLAGPLRNLAGQTITAAPPKEFCPFLQ
ncbi:MAG: RluA family pseudouridine synthase [Lachnospiraceae bacterium]|nr:RluA family pseudouridine synthase [Lachnospiraceae bacterium]